MHDLDRSSTADRQKHLAAAASQDDPCLARAPRLVRRSLLAKHIALLLVVVFPVTALSGWTCYVSARRILEDQITHTLTVLAAERGAKVSAGQTQQRRRIAILASRPRILRLLERYHHGDLSEPQLREQIGTGLLELRAQRADFLKVMAADPTGRVIAATDDSDLEQDVSSWEAFKHGCRASYLGRPQHDGGQLFAYLAAPIRDDPEDPEAPEDLLGVLIVTLDIAPAAQMIADPTRLGESGEVQVACLDGGKLHYLFPPRGRDQPMTSPADAPMMARAVRGQSSSSRHMDRGVEVLTVYQPIGDRQSGSNPWGLVAKIDVAEAFAPIRHLGSMLIFLEVLILVAGAGMSRFLTRRLTRNVLELADTATAFAQGDLEARVSIHSHDEIGILGIAFNRMAGELGRSRTVLEQRVQERTRALAQSNSELHDEVIERQRAEDSLAAVNAQLRSVLDAATQISIVATDLTGTITVFNAGAEQMLGYSAAEMIGKQTPALIHLASEIEDRGRELSAEMGMPIQGFDVFVMLAREHAFERREWTYVRKDASRLTVSLVVTAMRDSAGSLIGFLGIAEDVTERNRKDRELRIAKDRAEEASRAKSSFLANMSHEIRTPMNAVIGMTELVLQSELSPQQRDHLDCARISADHLLAVVNDILDFSKIEAGKLAIDPSPFDLHECVTDAARSLALRAHERGLELVTLVHADVPRLVIGDRIRLRQVLLNLVGNAIKFTHVGKVVIEVSDPAAAAGESEIHCEVRDTGIGIPRDKQSKIFDVFEQADNSSTRKYGGTGLGLAISSRLVELMGGRLWVESEPGQGSTFHFTIRAGKVDPPPRDASSAEPAICSDARVLVVPHPPVAARPLRVLLAEDSPLNQKLAVALLERRGHCVVVAADGVQAVERALAGPFDLALMDLQMPEMDGLEATETIREHERLNGGHLPIIALTAHAMVGDRARCVAAGMDAYVSKPIRDEQLFKTIESVLDRSDAEASSGATRIP